MDVKLRLQQLMNERGWTMYRLAKEAGVPMSTVRNMFKRNTDPSISTLEAICSSMGITLSQFFDIDNNMGLSQDQHTMLREWNMLDDPQKKLVQDLVESLNHRNE